MSCFGESVLKFSFGYGRRVFMTAETLHFKRERADGRRHGLVADRRPLRPALRDAAERRGRAQPRGRLACRERVRQRPPAGRGRYTTGDPTLPAQRWARFTDGCPAFSDRRRSLSAHSRAHCPASRPILSGGAQAAAITAAFAWHSVTPSGWHVSRPRIDGAVAAADWCLFRWPRP